MWNIFKKNKKAHELDIKVLFKNDISLLILDERWNGLFTNIVKTNDILERENNIKELLKEQSRLITEAKEIVVRKKDSMDRIIKLTTEAFENNNEEARMQMQDCEKNIVAINKRTKEIEERLENLPTELRQANLELLEKAVKLVYFSIIENQQRVSELDKEIEQQKEQLKKLIDEKSLLTQDDADVYSYFHDLLGKDELQKLDEIYFNAK